MKRHKQRLHHYRLLSMKMGELIPVGCVEVLPGDTFQHATSVLLRASPLVAPVMHPINVRLHHFFVPNRVIWDEWEDFITGGADLVGPAMPTLGIVEGDLGGLPDYLGVSPPPAGSGQMITVSALPFWAFNTIFNEYYRDQDLQTERLAADISIPEVCWEKDYFTSARPTPQKGADVTMPLSLTAPDGITNSLRFRNAAGTVHRYGEFVNGQGSLAIADPGANASDVYLSQVPNLGGNVNDIRRAFALQRYAEARSRYGSRYTEYLRYLGVRSSDARLQRPEYLGGGKQTVAFSEILQTAEGTDPVGTMRGHGIAALRSRRYRRFFEEHGYVISLLSVRPKTMYGNASAKHWFRTAREDYFQLELQNIGQQEVFPHEVFSQTNSTTPFGYVDRYKEYTFEPSTVHGQFRTTLDYWHLARLFASSPTLNASFVECVPDDRVFADQTGTDTLWVMVNHNLIARRGVSGRKSGRII